MVNRSKRNDLRFWIKWRESGAVSSGNKHFDKSMAIAARYELKGSLIEAGCMRVIANNDYTNWKSIPISPLGRIVLFHQMYEGTKECLYCRKLVEEWKSGEECFKRYNEKTS